jgi:SAM-dependent methyltransferase
VKLIPGTAPEGFRASIAATYDNVAAVRDERGEEAWRWPIAERFLATLQDEGRTRLVEIGAGVGYTSRWFADHGLAVVATDLSPAQVERCRAKGLDAHVRDMYDLRFAPESFQALWAMNCIHHVPDDDLPGVLRGFASVLTPGSPVYLGVWGGVDEAGFPEEDFYQPPRFFAFRTDESLVALASQVFDVEAFEAFVPEGTDVDDRLHMQSLFLRSRA